MLHLKELFVGQFFEVGLFADVGAISGDVETGFLGHERLFGIFLLGVELTAFFIDEFPGLTVFAAQSHQFVADGGQFLAFWREFHLCEEVNFAVPTVVVTLP